MVRSERIVGILELLAHKGRVDVSEIVTKFGVSEATARRDLDRLAEQQLLVRTHGGAVGQSVAYDLPLRYKNERQAPEKLKIAQAASELVRKGDVIGLCGGTTSTAVATVLSSRSDLSEPSPHPNLTVVTNAINIAYQLAMRPEIKTVVTGGVIHTRTYELIGPYANSVLENIRLDIAFIGVNAMDPIMGATVIDEREAIVNSVMASRAIRAIAIADSSKIGRTAFATVGAGALKTLITDDGINEKQVQAFENNGVTVIVA